MQVEQLLRQLAAIPAPCSSSSTTTSAGTPSGGGSGTARRTGTQSLPDELEQIVDLAQRAAAALMHHDPAAPSLGSVSSLSSDQGAGIGQGQSQQEQQPKQHQHQQQQQQEQQQQHSRTLLVSAVERITDALLPPPAWLPRPTGSSSSTGTGTGTDPSASSLHAVPQEAPAVRMQSKGSVQRYLKAAAAGMRAAAGMVSQLPLPALHDGIKPLRSASTQAAATVSPSGRLVGDAAVGAEGGLGGEEGAGRRTVRGAVVVEEVEEGPGGSEERRRAQNDEARRAEEAAATGAAQRLLLLASGFAVDPRLPSPWQQWRGEGGRREGQLVGAESRVRECGGGGDAEAEVWREAEEAAGGLVQALADATCCVAVTGAGAAGQAGEAGRHPARQVIAATAATAAATTAAAASKGSLSLLSSREARVQCLLGCLLPTLLPRLRRALIAAQPHVDPDPREGAPPPDVAGVSSAGAFAAGVSGGGGRGSGGGGGSGHRGATGAGAGAGAEGEAARLGLGLSEGQGGASAGERVVLARRMAWLVRATRHPYIGDLVSGEVCVVWVEGRREGVERKVVWR